MQGDVTELLGRAIERRETLFANAEQTDCFRLFNGAGDGASELTIDRFGSVLVVSLYQDLSPKRAQAWLDALERALGPRAVYVKRRAKSPADLEAPPDEKPMLGAPVEGCEVRERGLRFSIRPGQGLSVGLYLDARDARDWVERTCGGARVLNLFAYTCGFSVAARRGGAARAVNVDLSRRVLDWGRTNGALNGQATEDPDYLSGDVFDWLKRLARREERFDCVVADPPAFSSSRSGVFTAARDYARLAAACGAVLTSGGSFFALCNQGSLTEKVFEEQIRQGLDQVGRKIKKVERGGASRLDFPLAAGQVGPLKILRFSLG